MMRKNSSFTYGESVVLSYVFVIGITTILSLLLITSAANHLAAKQENVIETQAEITVEAIAAEVEEIDKTALKQDRGDATSGSIIYDSNAEKLIGQYPYKVRFESHPDPNRYTVKVIVVTNEVDVIETVNVTLYEINDVKTGVDITGSSLAYRYTQNGTLTLSQTTDKVCSVNVTTSYIISTDVTISSCINATGNITGGTDSIVYGDITSTGGIIDVGSNITVTGDVESGGSTEVQSNSIVTGNVTGENDVVVKDNTIVGGYVFSQMDVSTDSGVEISGDVRSRSNATLGSKNTVRGKVFAVESITVNGDSYIGGDVTSQDDAVFLSTNVTVNGTITAKNEIEIGSKNHIEGNVTSETSYVYVDDLTQVNATIKADSVDLQDDIIVTGDVIVPSGSDLSCGTNVTINGQSCSDYKSANY